MKRWFTLVEILIVIVIIGLLIWLLVPRMSAVQSRARDVLRKNDLSNLQAAIIVAYQDLWRYPCTNDLWCMNWDEVPAWSEEQWYKAEDWVDIVNLRNRLKAVWMDIVPSDPLVLSEVYWLGDDEQQNPVKWEYRYLTLKNHDIPDLWFVLMAKTELAWSSNRVTCTQVQNVGEIQKRVVIQWGIHSDMDVKNLRPCDSITHGTQCSNTVTEDENWIQTERICVYKDESDLRYVVIY